MQQFPRMLVLVSMLGCGVHEPLRAPVASVDLAFARVVERASSDFACPRDRIEPGPCTCFGAFAIRACDVDALYSYVQRTDGDYDVILMSASWRAR